MRAWALVASLAAVPLQQGPAVPGAASPAGAVDAFHFDLLKYVDRVERDGTHVRTNLVEVRLNTAQGVEAFGQLGSAYVEGYGDVQFGEVVIEKSDGRHVPITNGLVADVNPFGVTSTSMSADVRYRKLTIPGLEPGDRLSYRITQRVKPLAPGRVFGEMKLWSSADSPLQTYELDVPRDARVKVLLRKGIGADWEEVPSAPDRWVRRLSLKPPAASTLEKPTKEDLESLADPDVIFTSFDSWDEVANWWWGISKDRLAPDAAVAREASALARSATTPREKIAALHAFLVSRIRYVNVSFGLGRMQPRKAPEVLANRYGDCKDKHALLAAMAASLGIDVRPVLINSGRPVLRDEVPSPQQFDHMISVVRLGKAPEEWLWLDATNPFAGPGHLLPTLRDKPALLVESDGDAVVVRTPRDPPFATRQELVLKASLSPEGVLGRVSWVLRSDEETMLRSVFASVPQERRAAVIQVSLARDWSGAKVENVFVSDPLDVGSPFRVEFDAEQTIDAKGSERSVRVPFPEFDLPEAAEDVLPGGNAVSFMLRESTQRAEIELPEGQQARLPLSVSLERPFGAFRSAYTAEGRTLRLERTLRLPQRSIGVADVVSYEAFRSAIGKDHKQEFTVTGLPKAPAAVTALELRKAGTAALNKKEFTKAAELLRQATELDPKVAGGLIDLGRALCDLKKYEEAVQAFTRRIELSPFDEGAYGWRAYAHGRLDKWNEAEQDLHKQIEVAPFNAWPYRELGRRRSTQGRHQEAADFYARAATIEPKIAERWVDLARQQAWAGRAPEARQSLDKATALGPQDWLKIQAASVYRRLGDVEPAGRLAADALPSLTARLEKLGPDELDDGDRDWVSRLVEAWRYVGDAAIAAGDTKKAERYLEAAWRLLFLPEAGWALGELREKQGRLADAVELWSMASVAAGPRSTVLPADRQKRIEAACAKLPDVGPPTPPRPPGTTGAYEVVFSEPARQRQARDRLMGLRTVRLKGPVVANVTEEVLLLTDSDGRVEVTSLSRPEARSASRASIPRRAPRSAGASGSRWWPRAAIRSTPKEPRPGSSS